MKKLLLAAVTTCALLTQAHADKISDTFAEVEGLWCYSPETKNLDKAPKGWVTTIYTRVDASTKKRCNRISGNTDWIYIDNNTGTSGSEYTCVTVEGGDNGEQSVEMADGRHVKKMVFVFRQRCKAEGYKWF